MRQVLLIILDGWGLAPAWGGNAVEMSNTPNLDGVCRKFPHSSVQAAEEAVGLPIHEPGNSEVGHLNLGSGQVVKQNLPGISLTIKDGSFFNNSILIKAMNHVNANKSNLHLMGLVSDGGVHSHISHLYALLEMAKKNNIKNVYIHAFTDGRDTNPMKSLIYIANIEKEISRIGIGKIESVMGRYWAMDRDSRWDRTQKAYALLTEGIGLTAPTPEAAISESYRQNRTDEFIVPTIITNNDNKFVPINSNDAVIFFNFRADRARQLTQVFTQQNFKIFQRTKFLNNLFYATFCFLEQYIGNPNIHAVFSEMKVKFPLAKILEQNSLNQLHIAETEKYAHVTFFFNGGQEKPFIGEERILIPSPKVATYDLKPEMSAPEITLRYLENIGRHTFTILNFANPDMVGHTGNLKATIKACETVDECLGKILKLTFERNICTLITADHGNAEQMINPDNGEAFTEHTINPVPFIIFSPEPELQRPINIIDHHTNILADISPTILKILGINKPEEMTGLPLIDLK